MRPAPKMYTDGVQRLKRGFGVAGVRARTAASVSTSVSIVGMTLLAWTCGRLEGAELGRSALKPTSKGLELVWPAAQNSPDGTLSRPWFEVQFSPDLVEWKPLGQRLRAHTGGELRYSLPPGAPHGFYRVLTDATVGRLGPAEDGVDVFGYGPAFEAALQRIGQISVQEFGVRHASGAEYLPGISWDPTTARFWELFNGNPALLNQGKAPGSPGYRTLDCRLTSAELDVFRKHGFVVSERLANDRNTLVDQGSMGDVYYQLWYNDLPVFVSSDSVLHAWHRSFSMMLAEIEESVLRPMLVSLLADMQRTLPQVDAEVGRGVLRESLLDADYFVTMARSLLMGIRMPSPLKQDARVAATLDDIAKKELKTIPDFMGFCRTVDFSQFIVRGHYDESSALSTYFQAMMWLGRVDLPVAGGPFSRCFEESRMAMPRELGTALVLNHLIESSGGGERWRTIESILGALIGLNDSMTFPQLQGLLAGAGIRSLSDVTGWETLERLQRDIERGELGVQSIRSDAYFSPLGAAAPVRLPRSYRVFGQRFMPDSWVLSQMVYDSIRWNQNGTDTAVMRRVPSALDVAFSVLGNDQTVPLLVERILRPQVPPFLAHTDRFRDGLPYQHHLSAAREVIESQRREVWDQSLCMGWLDALRQLSPPTTSAAYPESMRTRAWAMKTLNTQLASWTQYQHDTVLYVKQSYTSIPACFYPDGFVEPRPDFWRQLQRMASRTAEALERVSYPVAPALVSSSRFDPSFKEIAVDPSILKRRQVDHLRYFAKITGTLASMADKELSQTPFTQEEQAFIQDIMQTNGTEEYGCGFGWRFSGWYPQLFYRPVRYSELMYPSGEFSRWIGLETYFHENHGCNQVELLVSDLHTDPPSSLVDDPGSVLHSGVGRVGMLLVAVDNGPDRAVYAGPVMPHYEFEVVGPPMRLTDTEWRRAFEQGWSPPGASQTLEGIALTPWTRDYWIR